ncbi:DcaP family trimeric outer membrane transporter [Gallaecimonas sp. GXIMD1310]|uniref:DcaP family trimeric outer membrane transporter n=1 Tax=Gallaecimonas sp. GXIMD1310 TaxID=3131926 RepID=UPI003252D19D
MNKSLIAGAIGAVLALPGHAAEIYKSDNTTVSVGGYIKASVMYSDYSDGPAPASSSIGRIYNVPNTIPVTGNSGPDPVLDFTARESRFNLATTSNIDGHTLKTYIEMDFLSGFNGNERVSNSQGPRLRHAYFSYDNWLFGQTFTTFQDTGSLPETADFLGPADSTVFVRQAQIRYTSGNWQFSIENPDTTYTEFGQAGSVEADSAQLPDVVARYNMKGDWGHFMVAGILRQLKADTTDIYGTTHSGETASGYGVSASGLFKVGDKDDFRFMVTAGDGLGRYIALNTFAGAAVKGTGSLDTISTVSAFAAYRHWWNDQMRSTFTLSGSTANNNNNYVAGTVNKKVQSAHVNLMYSPIKPLTFGVEYMFAQRELENGDKGDLSRVQFFGKYAF